MTRVSVMGNASVTFTIMSAVPFEIDVTNGIIRTIEYLDHEAVTAYNIVVVATCMDGVARTTEVTVVILDENDNAPQFELSTYLTDVCFRDAVSGMSMIQSIATDRDSGRNADINYSLHGIRNSSSLFTVDIFGRVFLVHAPRTSDIGEYAFLIRASDDGLHPLTGITVGGVRILNCTEHNFYFSSPFYRIEIYEGHSTFTDGSSSIEIGLSRIPMNVNFYEDVPTNPFTNTLNVKYNILRIFFLFFFFSLL